MGMYLADGHRAKGCATLVAAFSWGCIGRRASVRLRVQSGTMIQRPVVSANTE